MKGGFGVRREELGGGCQGVFSFMWAFEGYKLGSSFCFVVCFKVRGISLAVSLRGIHRLCFLEELTSREAAKFFFV